jgi:hypothetical protein
MSFALVTTHEVDGVARLTERYRKPLISALLGAWLAEVQALELVCYDLLTKRSPATAEGAVLDLLGKIVGQPREGRSDTHYRLWVAARILVNRSSGLARELLAIALKLMGDVVELREYAPRAVVITCHAPITGTDGVEVAKLLSLAKAAGVMLHFVWHDVSTAFRFAPSGTSELDSNNGFGRGRMGAVSDGRSMLFEPATVEPDDGAFLLVL